MTAAEARYHRARHLAFHAWAASQPQLVIPRVLDEPQPNALRFVEPAGLTTGAEPSCAPRVLTAHRAAPPATPDAGGSAPLPFDGPSRMSARTTVGPGLGGER